MTDCFVGNPGGMFDRFFDNIVTAVGPRLQPGNISFRDALCSELDSLGQYKVSEPENSLDWNTSHRAYHKCELGCDDICGRVRLNHCD